MRPKNIREIMNGQSIESTLTRISHEIIEYNIDTSEIAIVGIRTRGEYLANRLVAIIGKMKGVKLPLGLLDITLYRDDLMDADSQPVVHETKIDFDVSTKHIILVDDVLYTGRTIRAALNAFIDFGRPKSIQLAVLIDRGHRELPIRADYVGKNIPTSQRETVIVKLNEIDKQDQVLVV
jgi:pyrimidine operon attenuation protein/uracil phosphoribosyltransferase